MDLIFEKVSVDLAPYMDEVSFIPEDMYERTDKSSPDVCHGSIEGRSEPYICALATRKLRVNM